MLYVIQVICQSPLTQVFVFHPTSYKSICELLGFIGKSFNDLCLQNFVLMMTTLEIYVDKRFSVQNTACRLIILTWDSNHFLDIYCYICMIACTYVRTYVCM